MLLSGIFLQLYRSESHLLSISLQDESLLEVQVDQGWLSYQPVFQCLEGRFILPEPLNSLGCEFLVRLVRGAAKVMKSGTKCW